MIRLDQVEDIITEMRRILKGDVVEPEPLPPLTIPSEVRKVIDAFREQADRIVIPKEYVRKC